MGTLER